MPGDEMLKDGLSQDDCVAIASAYAGSGLIDFISVVGAQASDLKSEARIWGSQLYAEERRGLFSSRELPLAGCKAQQGTAAATVIKRKSSRNDI